MRPMTAKQREVARATGAVIIVGTSELNSVVAGRKLDAAAMMIKALEIDKDSPCTSCGRRCEVQIGPDRDATPKGLCARCASQSKAGAA
jgi:hypothetical protein